MNKNVMIIFSLLLSLILMALPLSSAWNPAWGLLTLLFWNYRYPRSVGVGVAWCIGMLVDGLSGSLFGLHAFSYALIVYLFDVFYRRFHMFPVLQQSLVIGLLIVVNFLVVTGVQMALTDTVVVWSILMSAVTSTIFWPIYLMIGKKLHLFRN